MMIDTQEKFWMIVDFGQSQPVSATWPGHCDDYIFPASSGRPRYLHMDRERAEGELLRLQERHPGGEFVLLEAVKWAERREMQGVSALVVTEVRE